MVASKGSFGDRRNVLTLKEEKAPSGWNPTGGQGTTLLAKE